MKIKNITRLIALTAIILSVGFGGCKNNELAPVVTDNIKPQPPANISVTNTPGGAVVRYSAPAETDLGGVEVRYMLQSGTERIVKVSRFSKEITVSGFAKSQKYTVSLYAFDMSGNYSDPVSVDINPLTPPVESIFKSLQIVPDFGGFNVKWENKDKAPVALLLLAKDSLTTNMNQIDAVYSSVESGDYSTRGLKSEENRFAVVVRDRFDNYSDTLFAVMTPLEEVKLDKTKFKPIILPTDRPSEGIDRLWDGDRNWICVGLNKNAGLPEHITFDLGVKAKLSRFIMYPYTWGNNLQYYYNYSARFFEIWGATNPNPDGSWDGWTLLKSCEVVKPSGLPVGPGNNSAYVTDEDIEAATKGFEFVIPANSPEVQYLRIKSLQAWTKSSGTCGYGEMEFFGQVLTDKKTASFIYKK